MNQSSAIQSQPQADGDSRPFNTHSLGCHVRVHVERRGPAFPVVAQDANETELLPLKVAEQLGASLIAQHSVAVGNVLSAIRRNVLADLMPAWTRLLAVQGVVLPKPLYEDVLVSQRVPWAYDNLLTEVIAALCQSGDGSPMAWLRPDMVIKQMARESAERSRNVLNSLAADWLIAERAGDAQAAETLRDRMVAVTASIDACVAFAGGK